MLRCALAALCLGAACAAAAPTGGARPLSEIRELGDNARGAPDASFAALQALRLRPVIAPGERVEVLTVLGLALADAKRIDPAAGVLRELEAWHAAQPDPTVKAAALAVSANLERQSGDLARAEAQLVEALAISTAAPASIERYRLLHMLARVRLETGAFDGGLQAAQETVRIAQALEGEPDGALLRGRALHQLAYLLVRTKQPERARDTVAEALRWVERSGNRAEASRARNTEGIVMSELGREADSVAAYRAALALAREAGWATQEVVVLGNLTDSLLRLGAYEPARVAALEALEKSRVGGSDRVTESLALTNLGLAELGLKRLEAGRMHIEQALAIERGKRARGEEQAILAEASAAYERAGDYAAAIAAYQQLRELQDRLEQRRHLRAVLDLQERYEREQRAREMGTMTERGALHDAQLRSQTLRQRAWALATAAGVLLLALAALLLRQHQSRNRAMVSTNEQLHVLGGRDPLTGVANRRQVRSALEGAPFAGTLLLIDLDHFKRVNDQAGHAAGDAVLIEVARRLREVLRAEGDLLARWGGEEFLIAVPALPPEQVEPLVLRLLAAVGAQPVDTEAGPQALTASIGYASFPLAPQGLSLPWERAVALIDAALYLAKRRGRNRACGIHLLRARSEAEVQVIVHGLDAAAQRGDVTLDWLAGPAAVAVAPPPEGAAELLA